MADWTDPDQLGQVAARQAGEFVEAFAGDLQFGDAGAQRIEQPVVIGELGEDPAGAHRQSLLNCCLRRMRASSSPLAIFLLDGSELSTLSTGQLLSFFLDL